MRGSSATACACGCSRHGRHFLLRVGGNITLLKGLGYYHEERDGLVYLWPRKHRRCRPLVLRLIVLRQGKQDVYLLTDVLDPAGVDRRGGRHAVRDEVG